MLLFGGGVLPVARYALSPAGDRMMRTATGSQNSGPWATPQGGRGLLEVVAGLQPAQRTDQLQTLHQPSGLGVGENGVTLPTQ